MAKKINTVEVIQDPQPHVEPKGDRKKTFAAIVLVVVVIAAIGLTMGGGGGNGGGSGNNGQVEMNYTTEDQLIIDTDTGSTTPDDGMIFCIVSYTIHNGSNQTVSYYSYDVNVVSNSLRYGNESLYLHDDGSWRIEPGATHRGFYAFELPENHRNVTFSLGIDTVRNSSLTLQEIPEREAGQVYGVVYYDVFALGDLFVVSLYMKNVSYESTISSNPYNFLLTDGVGTISHSWESYSLPSYNGDIVLGPGYTSDLFSIAFDRPVGWSAEDLSIVWDGIPDRGMIVTDSITEFYSY